MTMDIFIMMILVLPIFIIIAIYGVLHFYLKHRAKTVIVKLNKVLDEQVMNNQISKEKAQEIKNEINKLYKNSF